MRIIIRIVLLAALGFLASPVLAQDTRSEASANVTGNFQRQASGDGTTDTASGSGGLLFGYRFHFNNWNAIEVNYSYTNFSQRYTPGFTTQARANELGVAYVNTLGRPADARIRPFFEVGTGGLVFSPIPAGSTTNGSLQTRPALVYGGGVDFRASDRISVRLGYRGLLYTAPDFFVNVEVTKALTQMAEPYAGVVFRF
jgi:outer membrane immunogenic protein